jgi:hypothetical protein
MADFAPEAASVKVCQEELMRCMGDEGEFIPGSGFSLDEAIAPEEVNRAVQRICTHVVNTEMGRVRRVLSERLAIASAMSLGIAVGGYLLGQHFLLFALPVPIVLLLIFLPLYSALSTREIRLQLVEVAPRSDRVEH